jgi:hypothetical protein
MTHPADRDRRRPMETEGSAYGLHTDDSGSIHSTAQGASVIQVETLGRLGLFVILVMFVVIVLIGMLAGFALGAGEERDETVDQKLSQMNSRVSVLEYDAKNICAGLLAKKILEACH